MSNAPKILVIGDTILDKYIFLESKKISDEAPVITYEQVKYNYVLGGGSNVIKNLKNLNSNCHYLGLASIETKAILKNLFNDLKIKHSLFLAKNSVPIKTRFMSKNQQIFRYDTTNEINLDKNTFKKIKTFLKNHLQNFDVIIFSKYFDGFITPDLVNFVTSNFNKITYLDNRQNNNYLFKNISILKLNWNEYQNMIEKKASENEEEIIKNLKKIYRKNSFQKIILTRADKNVIVTSGNKYEIYKVPEVKVVDVSGAGDTFVATLALMNFNRNFSVAMEIAIYSSSLVVGKVGTSSIYSYELKNFFQNSNKLSDLLSLIKDQKFRGKKIVLTNGVFDILHLGHLDLLKKAKNKGDILVVAINSDKSVKTLKGINRPVNNQIDRKKMLESLSFVDFVYIFDELDAINIIEKILPDVYVKGGDYNEKNLPEKKVLQKIPEIFFVPKTEDKSTSCIIEKIINKK